MELARVIERAEASNAIRPACLRLGGFRAEQSKSGSNGKRRGLESVDTYIAQRTTNRRII